MTTPEGNTPGPEELRPDDEAAVALPADEAAEGATIAADDEEDDEQDGVDPGDVDTGDEEENAPTFLQDALTSLKEDPPTSIDGLNGVRSSVSRQMRVRRAGNGRRGRTIYTDLRGRRLDSRQVAELVHLTEPQSWWIAPEDLGTYVAIATASSAADVPANARIALQKWRQDQAPRPSVGLARPGMSPAEARRLKKDIRRQYKDNPDGFHGQRGDEEQAAFERAQKPIRAALAITHEIRLSNGDMLHPSSLRHYKRMLMASSIHTEIPHKLREKYEKERGIWYEDVKDEKGDVVGKRAVTGPEDHPKPVTRYPVLTEKEMDTVLRGTGGGIKERCIVSDKGDTREDMLSWQGGTSQGQFDAFKALISDRISRHYGAEATKQALQRVRRHDRDGRHAEARRGSRPQATTEAPRHGEEDRRRAAARAAVEEILRRRGII